MVAKKKRLLVFFFLMTFVTYVGYQVHFFAPGVFEHISSYLVYPVLRVQHTLVDSVKTWANQRQKLASLEDTLRALQAERDMLLAQTVSLRSMIDYAHDTKELVECKKGYEDGPAKIAQILVRTFSENEHTFLVDAGSRDGIELDMVAVYKNCLVGRVECVYPWYSKVRLITDKSCKVSAYCAGTDSSGIHEGTNEYEHTVLCFVSHLSNVTNGDLVLSSGEGPIFPRGFGLGHIENSYQEGLYYTIIVKPLIDLKELKYCVLIAKGSNGLAMQPSKNLLDNEEEPVLPS
ncbi:MAG: rod shape-determining protein MreC [bacterium]|nr:rod shape-determining protein MreC [bacterium]